MDELYVGPSKAQQEWDAALSGQQDGLLALLTTNEPPGVAIFEIMTYINGLYRHCQRFGLDPKDQTIRDRIDRALDPLEAVRHSLGWRQREVDLTLMRSIRRSSALSAVLGAGVTMDAGGPSWPELVRRLVEVALAKGHEVAEMVRTADSTDEHVKLVRAVVDVKRFEPAAERDARALLKLIEDGKADTEALMRAVQLCNDLWGQHLFTHLTGILYKNRRQPGAVHRQIAALAHPQFVPDRGGTFFGWDSIITYNFEDLMGEAVDAERLPRVAWGMRGDEIAGDPNRTALKAGQKAPHLSIYHLHGYTPRKPFLITSVKYVFSTKQYIEVYKHRPGIVEKVFREHLANPVHYALYIGCSFTDEKMNDLLRAAAEAYHGRRHYALLQWKGKRSYPEVGADEIAEAGKPYLELGIQPVWFDSFSELAPMISSLK